MEQLKNSPTPEGGKKAGGKKVYTLPELLIYGNLAQITSTVGTAGMYDGGFVLAKSKPYQDPAFRYERVFETMALACGKIEPTTFQCRFHRKNS